MHKIVISDTSCFIVLGKINQLGLLQKLYGRILTTNEIAEEFGEQLPEWVDVLSLKDKSKQQLLELYVDRGESSAMALAIELEADLIILDDHKARVVARKLDLNVTGTLGVLISAKKQGFFKSIKPFLRDLKKTNFRITEDLEKEALKQAGEL
ncbi:MAG: DUF3368 domain-containing protein [Cyclobacteriaceae bacterium]